MSSFRLFSSSLLFHFAIAVESDAIVPFNSIKDTVDTFQYSLAFIVVLVAAHPFGLLFPRLLKLPLITGYLIIGVIAGPFVTNLLPKALVNMLSPSVNGLALSFISFQAGQEIYLPELRPQLKQIFILLTALYVTAMTIVTSVHFLANNAFFYDTFTPMCQLGIALMFGSISVLGSPATVMAIKIEYNSVGPFTNLMLGATMTAEFVVLISFSIARIVCSSYCADLNVSVENVIFSLAIVASNLVLGLFIGIIIILIFKIPGSTADEHMDLHDPQSSFGSHSEDLEAIENHDQMPNSHNVYVEAIDEIKHFKLWTPTVSLYTKGFLWISLGYMFYLSNATISEATVASYGLTWEVRFEPLLVLMLASCLAGHYSLIRHDMHVILDTVAPYMFLPFFVMTGAALKLDSVAEAISLVSLYICLRFLSVLLACYLGGRYLLRLPPKQYNNLWLTMTPQAGVALGLADEVKGLSTEPWAAQFATTIIAAVVINQIIGPVLCAVGLKRAGESIYHRNDAANQSGRSMTASSAQSNQLLTQNKNDPRALLPFYKVKNAVIIGEDEVAFEIALELSLYGAQVNVPLLDKEQADKWHTINETIRKRSSKGDLIQYKNKINDRQENIPHMHGMAAADVLIFTGDSMRSIEYIRTIKAQLGEGQPRMIAIISDSSYNHELNELGVLMIQPSIALANIATRMALLEHKLAESLSHEISTTSDFETAAYFMEGGVQPSLSKMRLDGRRLALGRSVVTHHSVNYDKIAEVLAAVNLPMPPPPLRVSMFGTSAAGFDPFANRGDEMSALFGVHLG
ncbi:hypothetical protein L917_07263 [Plasmopara halstedii]|uniref:Cation/H+ exchanger transmembrane domain-containing protein n=1 Tax=Plasmopara halstedii TaxID=4781 RepID=A0A0P1AHN3_PLAHL|nr:hypothetical protein L917_07263 [Plasmopara halstedii]CEG40186.1 hypothetical protein L917_07263 [Plasmopara halstedii]|eukprot:XP_024576555.1 hypothetical protein L917_07263 [Plasmopara halstedii]